MILVPRIGGGNEVRIGAGASLLVLVALEASLLGSGRLLQIGPLTVKMWLFVAAQLYVIFRLLTFGRLKLSTLAIIMSFIVLLCFGVTLGLLRHSTLELVGEDIKPLLYCFMLCFFEMVISTKKQLRMIVRIIEFASVLMSVGYIVVITLLFLGFMNFATVYGWLSVSSQEFFFRGDSGLFFYKGALYIGVGIICLAFERSRIAKLALALSIIGIIATGTRGFLVGLATVILAHVATGVLSLGKKVKYIGLLCIGALLTIALVQWALPDKTESDSVRVEILHEVEQGITPLSSVFGNGFGIGLDIGTSQISYLEIFYKQGLLGLTWWALVFILLLMRYRKARRINYLSAQPLFLSVIFVIVESATNPFVNNPIGIFVWLIALVGMDVLSGARSSTALLGKRELAVP
jgi:hypothetical protein